MVSFEEDGVVKQLLISIAVLSFVVHISLARAGEPVAVKYTGEMGQMIREKSAIAHKSGRKIYRVATNVGIKDNQKVSVAVYRGGLPFPWAPLKMQDSPQNFRSQ